MSYYEPKLVPARLYEPRWRNAQRVFNRFKELEDQGYLIFDAEGELVNGFYVGEDGAGTHHKTGNGSCYFLWFMADPGLDNGAYDTISDFNRQFDDWKIVPPGRYEMASSYLKKAA